MLHDARENFSDEHIVYDTMDIENHDPGSLTERYGAFDRVYSFLTFHYVADITKAYGNVCKLLKQGGECLVLSVVKADAIDVWNEVYQMEEWNALIINPASLFPGMVHSDSAIRSAEQLASHTRESISTAGLHCLTYYRYNSRWVFRRMEDYVDAFMSSFKAHNGVPPEKQSTLRDVWIDLFQKKTHVGLGREFPVTYTFSIVHAQKPYYS